MPYPYPYPYPYTYAPPPPPSHPLPAPETAQASPPGPDDRQPAPAPAPALAPTLRDLQVPEISTPLALASLSREGRSSLSLSDSDSRASRRSHASATHPGPAAPHGAGPAAAAAPTVPRAAGSALAAPLPAAPGPEPSGDDRHSFGTRPGDERAPSPALWPPVIPAPALPPARSPEALDPVRRDLSAELSSPSVLSPGGAGPSLTNGPDSQGFAAWGVRARGRGPDPRESVESSFGPGAEWAAGLAEGEGADASARGSDRSVEHTEGEGRTGRGW